MNCVFFYCLHKYETTLMKMSEADVRVFVNAVCYLRGRTRLFLSFTHGDVYRCDAVPDVSAR